MTGILKALDAIAISLAILLLAHLVDLAREKGVMVQSIAVSFLALVAVLIGGSVIWFKLVELPALHY